LNINATGAVALRSASTGADGTGIVFPATQNASTNVNTLDDYEEGTWTPAISTSGGAITSYSSSGTYVKVGRLVTITFSFSVTNYTGGSGTGLIGGLPFTSSSSGISGAYRESSTSGAIHTLAYSTSTILSSFASTAWTTGSVGAASVSYITS
jgi:hypothetical protein